jgi:hypothetical protein
MTAGSQPFPKYQRAVPHQSAALKMETRREKPNPPTPRKITRDRAPDRSKSLKAWRTRLGAGLFAFCLPTTKRRYTFNGEVIMSKHQEWFKVVKNERSLTPGNYLHELIEQKSREVAKRHNAAGYISMWSVAVREVLQKFPNLSAAERATLRATVESGIQRLSARINLDIHQFAGARDSVARILGGASC